MFFVPVGNDADKRAGSARYNMWISCEKSLAVLNISVIGLGYL